MNIRKISKDFLKYEIGSIKAIIRNKNGIIDPVSCKHEFDILRKICIKCGITEQEINQ